MKKFLVKLILFLLIPSLLWGVTEALLPITFFTHRHNEAIQFKTDIPRYNMMYPHVVSSCDAVGDLCYNTDDAVIKKEIWITDKLGFRNDQFVEEADILFIGDSFVQGSGLNQHETISNQLKALYKGKKKVYNMAPSNFNAFDKYFRKGVVKKPKCIILSIVERNVPEVIKPIPPVNLKFIVKEKIKDGFEFKNSNIYLDKTFKSFSIEWIRARLRGSKGTGKRGIGKENMFFLSSIKTLGPESQDSTFNIICSYKKYCDSLGIEFLFLPIPNKETVYFEMVPFEKQPPYLFHLDARLTSANITTINTLAIYNNYRKVNNKLLYHLDDTHWNSNAIALVVAEIKKKLDAKKE